MCTTVKSKNAEPKETPAESDKKPKTCSSKGHCENCKMKARAKAAQRAKRKKKPMRKLGCWRGAFKATLDF